jgi:hypothetical protein
MLVKLASGLGGNIEKTLQISKLMKIALNGEEFEVLLLDFKKSI